MGFLTHNDVTCGLIHTDFSRVTNEMHFFVLLYFGVHTGFLREMVAFVIL